MGLPAHLYTTQSAANSEKKKKIMYERSSSRYRNKGLGLALLVPFSFLRATERERIPGYFLLHSYPYPSLLNSSLIGKTVVWYLMVQNGKTIIRSVVYLEAIISRLTHGDHFFWAVTAAITDGKGML